MDGRAEDYAEEARYFVECRLLQRDVEIILESTSNQNFVGSVMHPKGNIAELLLKEGFAKCVDWSITLATSGPEILRAAEKFVMHYRFFEFIQQKSGVYFKCFVCINLNKK